jgi:toxin ParE1/3/4
VKRGVVWADTARRDYLRALAFIAKRDPDAAERVGSRIEAAVAKLGERATGRPGRIVGTYERSVTDLPYIIAYEIMALSDGGEAVAILHIIHTARDWQPDTWPKD